MNLEEHMRRHMAFSKATFGPGERRDGVLDHIRQEIEEVREEGDPREWVDLVKLSLDGMWRSIMYNQNIEVIDGNFTDAQRWEMIPRMICYLIEEKQTKNELRDWPNWRDMDPTKAINHDRSKD